MARRFGSAMTSNTDSTLFIYATRHIRVNVYNNELIFFGRTSRRGRSGEETCEAGLQKK